MLKKENRIKIDYNILAKSISIRNIQVIPVIIDYGKSSGNYFDQEYFLNKSSCEIQDIISLLLSSLNIIVNKVKIPKDQFSKVITLTNFFDGKYISKYITESRITNFQDLRKFTDRAKKYDEIIFGNKPGTENKKLYHFREYLQTYFSDELQPLNITYNDYISFRGKYNYRQVFEYISAQNNQERYDSFRNIFYNFKTCSLPQSQNRFIQCMISMNFGNNLFKMYNNYKTFQKFGNTRDKKIKELYNNSMYWIRSIYLENKGLEIGFKIDKNIIDQTEYFNIMNVLFSIDSYLYKNPFYLQQFEKIFK